jgi:membrane associated rhomboid family serine protease
MNKMNTINYPVTCLFLTAILVSGCIGFYQRRYYYRMVLHPVSVVRQREWYRLLTADWVHNDWLHLLLNGLILYAFGGNLEELLRKTSAWGSLQFGLIYLTSMLAANVAVTFRHRQDFGYSTAGASGSIMGCMFGLILVAPNLIAFYLPVAGAVKSSWFGLYSIVLLLAYHRRKDGMISYEAHFFGALGGIAATLIIVH